MVFVVPDFGVPESSEPIVRLAEDVRKEVKLKKGLNIKMLIHCSAGVGRSGTFIGLYQLMETLDQIFGKNTSPETFETVITDNNIDLFNTVFQLRNKRMQMVCSIKQLDKFLRRSLD